MLYRKYALHEGTALTATGIPSPPGQGGQLPPSPMQAGIPGPLPPMMPPPVPPVPPPPPGPMGGASPLAGLLADLPTNLTPGWQAIDMGIRCIRTALRSADFQKAPEVVATVQSVQNVLNKLISAYTSGTPGGDTSDGAQGHADEGGQPTADADAQPSASASSSGDTSGEQDAG